MEHVLLNVAVWRFPEAIANATIEQVRCLEARFGEWV